MVLLVGKKKPLLVEPKKKLNVLVKDVHEPAIARFAMKMFMRDLLFLVKKMRISTVELQTTMKRNRRHRKISCSV